MTQTPTAAEEALANATNDASLARSIARSAEIEAVLHRHEEAGRTVSLLATASGVLALFAVADTIKPSSAAAIGELKAMGITPVMLTGDN